MKKIEIDGNTRICGLIGNPVAHSMSPFIHNAAFEKLGLNYKYFCFKVENNNLRQAIMSMRAIDIKGMNVTVPYKQQVIPFLDELDEVAKKIGAVNTIVNNRKKLKGFNTDYIGLIKAIEEHTTIKGKKIVLLGAGGAARGIAFGIIEKKGSLIILNRTVAKAKELAKEFGCEYGGLELMDKEKADLLINSTSVGMHPKENETIAKKSQLKNFKIVLDAVYNPIETKLLKLARDAGCKTISGLNMLVYQGAASFELWTGKKPDTKLMKKIAIKKLKGE